MNKATLTCINTTRPVTHQRQCLTHLAVVVWYAPIEDTKEEVSDCLQLDTLDKTRGGDWSDLQDSLNADAVSHSAETQDVSLSAAATGM